MISGKRRVLFLNKTDLAEAETTKRWMNLFRSNGEDVYPITAVNLRSKETIAVIDKMTKEIVDKANERGIRKNIRAMVIGVPNVGKSTLINRLRGASITQNGDRPGVTKSNQWVRITPYLELLDTPGMLWPRLDDQEAAISRLLAANKNSVVMLLNGAPIDMSHWLNAANAVVEAWYPGEQGAQAMTEIIFGDCNPSAKLPTA